MFIRWRRRRWLPSEAEARIEARLVVDDERRGEAERCGLVDTIDEARRGDKWFRRWFWRYVRYDLDAAGVDGDDRARIEAALEAVVPRPA